MNHTPGPWTIEYEDDDGNLLENGVTIESCEGPVAFNVIDCSAPLIAAAPELLASLKEALDVMGDWGEFVDTGWAERARAAIAKAESRNGGLTLGDIKDQIEMYAVEINGQLYPATSISGGALHLWETNDRRYDNEEPDRSIDLDNPIKVKGEEVILLDPLTGLEETMVFGKHEWIPIRIMILGEFPETS